MDDLHPVWHDVDGGTVDAQRLPGYTEDQLKTMLTGYPEEYHKTRAGYTKAPIDKKKRRARNKRARASRKRNR